MTTAAWDGATLAADKRTDFGGLHGTTTKVHRINSMLVTGCGSTALIQEMLEWIREGSKPETFPAANREAEKCVTMLVICTNGTIHQYENTPRPIVIENKYWAIGSGRDFAMAVMHLGHAAEKAVQVAAFFDRGTGNGVDTMTFG